MTEDLRTVEHTKTDVIEGRRLTEPR